MFGIVQDIQAMYERTRHLQFTVLGHCTPLIILDFFIDDSHMRDGTEVNI
jgi:hypothetical protein